MQILFSRKLIYFGIYDIQIYILIKCIFKKEILYQKRKFTLESNFSLKLDDIFKKKKSRTLYVQESNNSFQAISLRATLYIRKM